jgi:hypothetical protein
MNQTLATTATRRLRREAAQIGEDIGDLIATLVRMGERSGWKDARLALIEADIRHFEWQRAQLLEAARVIEATTQAA